MSVTQTLMGPGRWQVTFKTAADGGTALPESIRSLVGLVGWSIIIGPKGLTTALTSDADRLAAVDAANGYAGAVLERPDEFSFAGQDLSWWLSTTDGIGPLIDAGYFYTGSRTTEQIVDAILTGNPNGISKGSVTNGDAVTNPVIPPYTPVLHALNWLCEVSDVEWQMRPDGTVDVAPKNTLFPAASAASATIITDDASGDEGGLSGVQALALSRATDATNIAGRAVVARGEFNDRLRFNTASQTPTGVEWKDFDGNTPTRSVTALAGGATSAQADKIATRIVGLASVDHRTVTLTSRTHNVTSEVLPGEKVWCYDLREGLYDTSTQVMWRGQLISPVELRVAEITWPITGDLGVYLRQNNGGVWYDVTSYVQAEDAVVSWVVSKTGRRANQLPIRLSNVSVGPRPRTVAAQTEGRRTSVVEGAWSPTWTNLTVGTGGSALNEGRWHVANGEMRLQATAVLGTGGGAGVSGAITVDLPSGWQVAMPSARLKRVGPCNIIAAGTTYIGLVDCDGATSLTKLRVRAQVASGTYLTATATSATVPNTFAAGDSVDIDVTIPVERT